MAPIHDAVKKLDPAALQRELDAGVSPDLIDTGWTSSAPLRTAINYGSAIFPAWSIHRRLACIEVLLDAGASMDTLSGPGDGETALHAAVSLTDRSNYPANFELIVDRLLRAGADVNAIDDSEFDDYGRSVLAAAALKGTSTTVAKLLSAGAVDPKGFDEPLRCALERPEPRICALLMRAGAKLPIHGRESWVARSLERSPYLRKVYETPGGFKAYEKAHRQRLTAIFLSKSKFQSLPDEIVSHIVSLGFHCGCY